MSRLLLIGSALLFLAVFLVMPLLAVFAQALAKGFGAYFAAIAEPMALSAVKLTLLGCAHRGAFEFGIRGGRLMGNRKIRFSR